MEAVNRTGFVKLWVESLLLTSQSSHFLFVFLCALGLLCGAVGQLQVFQGN